MNEYIQEVLNDKQFYNCTFFEQIECYKDIYMLLYYSKFIVTTQIVCEN